MSNEILNYLNEHGPATHQQIAKALKMNPDFAVQDLKILIEDEEVTFRGGLYDVIAKAEKAEKKSDHKKSGPEKSLAITTTRAPSERLMDRPSSIRIAIQDLGQRLAQPKAPELTDKALKLEVLEQLAKLMSDDIAEVLMEIGSDLSALPEASEAIDGVAA